MNSIEHSIKVIQENFVDSTKTDNKGIFSLEIDNRNKFEIIVNENSPVLNKRFNFKANGIINNDTLYLKISDKKLVIYKDSISANDFYSKYNEKKAVEHFNQGKRELLAIGGEISKSKRKYQENLTKKFDVKFNYVLFGSMVTQSELRILDRYNSRMKELLGIKNVW